MRIVKGNKTQCRSDFAMKLIAKVEAGPLTGYQAMVMRQVDKLCFFPPITQPLKYWPSDLLFFLYVGSAIFWKACLT